MMTQALLDTRQRTHGSFARNALLAQTLRALFRAEAENWEAMPVEHCEALDMIACKLSRILSGQSAHADHFIDIAGYATLAARACAVGGDSPSDPLPLVSLPSGIMDATGQWHNRMDS